MQENDEVISCINKDTLDIKLFSQGSDVKRVKLGFVNCDYAGPIYIDFDNMIKKWRIQRRNWRTGEIETVTWIEGRIK